MKKTERTMKNSFYLLLLLSLIWPWGIRGQTNDFYDDAATTVLPAPAVEVTGEIANPGRVDFSKLPLHTVACKETRMDDSVVFTGTYRYDGYSLCDILNDKIVKKINEEEFSSVIDLYVIVENDAGERTVLSWGEIYYPVHHDEIIIATRVAPIVPSKTKDIWPMPQQPRLVVGSDLVSIRNLSNPSRIIIKSYPYSFPVKHGMQPMYSPEIKVFDRDREVAIISDYPADIPEVSIPTVFYGRGRGIHGITTFTGIPLDGLLSGNFAMTETNLKQGLFAVAAEDGYRCVFTFSEVFNRNDRQTVLLVDRGEDPHGGRFSLFPSYDFFSDRAVKAISEVHFILVDDF
jgi:hypothetical protein